MALFCNIFSATATRTKRTIPSTSTISYSNSGISRTWRTISNLLEIACLHPKQSPSTNSDSCIAKSQTSEIQPNDQKFTTFTRLPTELQDSIWTMASCEPRVVKLLCRPYHKKDRGWIKAIGPDRPWLMSKLSRPPSCTLVKDAKGCLEALREIGDTGLHRSAYQLDI
jgi:hypothetical protein